MLTKYQNYVTDVCPVTPTSSWRFVSSLGLDRQPNSIRWWHASSKATHESYDVNVLAYFARLHLTFSRPQNSPRFTFMVYLAWNCNILHNTENSTTLKLKIAEKIGITSILQVSARFHTAREWYRCTARIIIWKGNWVNTYKIRPPSHSPEGSMTFPCSSSALSIFIVARIEAHIIQMNDWATCLPGQILVACEPFYNTGKLLTCDHTQIRWVAGHVRQYSIFRLPGNAPDWTCQALDTSLRHITSTWY